VLAARAAAGDHQARAALARALQPLVARLAARFAGRVPRPDLEQSGMIGVLAAVPGYDPERGSFEAYATPFVVGEMLKVARGAAPVHVSRGARELARAVVVAADALTAQSGRSPTVAEVAAAAGLSEEQVVEGMAARGALAAPEPAEEEMLEALGGEVDAAAAAALRLELGERLARLDGRSRAVVALRFGLDLSQGEIAARLGISQMHVSRLLRAALERLDDED
jgi:RNA polymerase sigma-B factor